MTNSDSSEKKAIVLRSMLVLAGLVGAAVLLTAFASSYFRGQDPVNQCITNPTEQPFQMSIPIKVTEDGHPATVRGVGITDNCTRPVHTLQDNIIHVAYEHPYEFTLGHFFYYWLGDDILKYDVKVSVNGKPYQGDFRDVVLVQGEEIEIDLSSKG